MGMRTPSKTNNLSLSLHSLELLMVPTFGVALYAEWRNEVLANVVIDSWATNATATDQNQKSKQFLPRKSIYQSQSRIFTNLWIQTSECKSLQDRFARVNFGIESDTMMAESSRSYGDTKEIYSCFCLNTFFEPILTSEVMHVRDVSP